MFSSWGGVMDLCLADPARNEGEARRAIACPPPGQAICPSERADQVFCGTADINSHETPSDRLPADMRWRDSTPALAHPEAVALYHVADRLFAAGQVVLVEERAHLGAAPLIDHPLDGVVFLERLLGPVRGGHLFEHGDDVIALAGIEQGQGAVMAGDVAIE